MEDKNLVLRIKYSLKKPIVLLYIGFIQGVLMHWLREEGEQYSIIVPIIIFTILYIVRAIYVFFHSISDQ